MKLAQRSLKIDTTPIQGGKNDILTIRDENTGDLFFVKKVDGEQLALATKAGNLPKYKHLEFTGVVGNLDDLNPALKGEIETALKAASGEHFMIIPSVDKRAVDFRWQDESGERLREALKGKPATEDELRAVAGEIGDMNEAGVYNRDLPSNIYFHRDDSGILKVSIIDFGPEVGAAGMDAVIKDKARPDVEEFSAVVANLIDREAADLSPKAKDDLLSFSVPRMVTEEKAEEYERKASGADAGTLKPQPSPTSDKAPNLDAARDAVGRLKAKGEPASSPLPPSVSPAPTPPAAPLPAKKERT